MKFLKYLLYALLILVAILIILGLIGPSSYNVSRSAMISAPSSQVWPHISSLQKANVWSPWAKKDTTMNVEWTGTDGSVGSGQKWESKKMGKGEQTITAIEPGKSVTTELKFYMPWGVGTANSSLALADTAGQTNVTWTMWGKNDFIGKIFALLMPYEKAIAKDFDEGLANLQEVVTSAPYAMPTDMNLVPEDYPGGKYLGVRSTISVDQIKSFYEEHLGNIFGELQKSGVEMTSAPTGLYYTWDMETMKTDMAAAVGFKGDLKTVPKGMAVLNVPAGKALVMNYMGGYHGLGAAHGVFEDHGNQNNVSYLSPVLEEYLTDPGQEPDSMKWHTKITYLIKG